MRIFGVLFMLLIAGCAPRRSPELKAADATRRKAIETYASASSQVQAATQDAYRQECFKHIDDLFTWDLEKLDRAAGPDGKLPVADAKAYLLKIMAQREVNRGAVDAKLVNLNAALATNQRNLITFLRLDDMMQEWEDAGIDPTAAQNAINSIISILTKNPPTPALK